MSNTAASSLHVSREGMNPEVLEAFLRTSAAYLDVEPGGVADGHGAPLSATQAGGLPGLRLISPRESTE